MVTEEPYAYHRLVAQNGAACSLGYQVKTLVIIMSQFGRKPSSALLTSKSNSTTPTSSGKRRRLGMWAFLATEVLFLRRPVCGLRRLLHPVAG